MPACKKLVRCGVTSRVSWFDMPVRDLDRAIDFYRVVLDCEITVEKATSGSIGVIAHSDGEIAGSLFKKEGYLPSPQGILVYLNVNGRLEEAVQQVRRMGGHVLREAHAISPWGYRAIVLDCEGNRVALHSYH